MPPCRYRIGALPALLCLCLRLIWTGVVAETQAVSGCMVNFSDPEGYIDSSDDPPLPDGTFLHCTYTVTVYTGYGVELQVKSVNLSRGEQLSSEGWMRAGPCWFWPITHCGEGQVIEVRPYHLSILPALA
nr:seizure 6-like protein [Salvelinus alpinus]